MARKSSPKNFEDALGRLENITQQLNSPLLSLDEAIAQYEEGMRLLQYCQEKLDTAEQAIMVLENQQLTSWEPERE